MTLRDLIEQRDNLKAKLEVYRQLSIYLQEFISTDNREAKKFIGIEGADNQFVPDFVVEEVLEEIENIYIDKIQKEIIKLEEREF